MVGVRPSAGSRCLKSTMRASADYSFHMPLDLYNTLTNQVERFEPLDADGPVTFYSCGPTVYDYAHIGNFRSFLNADILRRVLEVMGYEVRHVMNITDVGHMTEDADPDGGGEDKMEVATRRMLEAKKSGTLPDGVEGHVERIIRRRSHG